MFIRARLESEALLSGFDCELLVAAIEATALLITPEMPVADFLEELSFQAICDEIVHLSGELGIA